jgi:DNA-binding transcriptional LysR family regulator
MQFGAEGMPFQAYLADQCQAPQSIRAPSLLDGRLKLRHLVLIEALAQRQSVLGAAQQLHVTQPALSRALRELEAVVGVELFERGPRGITPTMYGTAFIGHARAVLLELRAAQDHIKELATANRGTVTVGTHLAGSNMLLPRAIASLKAAHAKLTVIVQEATPDVLLVQLLSGEIDLIVGRLTPLPNALCVDQRALYSEPIRLVTRSGHPAAAIPSPTLADLSELPWILPVSGTVLRQELEQEFLDGNVSLPSDRVECTSILTLRQLLLDTDRIAALPMLIAREDNRLAILPTLLKSVHRPVGVTRRTAQKQSPATEEMLKHLRLEAGRVRRLLRRRDESHRLVALPLTMPSQTAPKSKR